MPKKIYKKSPTIFSPTEDCLEEHLATFTWSLLNAKMVKLEASRPSTNITKLQQQLNLLHDNEHFIVLNANKNLGPCIIEHQQYIKNVLHEHLQNGETYMQLNETDAL